MRKEAKREVEVSFADFTALGARVDGMEGSVTAATAAAAELKDKVVTPLSDAVTDLRDAVKRAGEPRDMDTLFHSRIAKLEAAVGDVRSEVQLALGDVLEGGWGLRGPVISHTWCTYRDGTHTHTHRTWFYW